MQKKTHYLILFFIFFACLGCGKNSITTKVDSEYPPIKYLTAIGIGQSESEARGRAVAEMARIFEATVYSDAYDRVKSTIGTSGEETYTQSIESNIRITSDVNLKGVRIAKTWVDENKKSIIALAVLEKNQTRNIWLTEIRDMDHQIEGEFNVLLALKSPFQQLISFRKIVNIWIQREVIVSRLKVLGFNEGSSTVYDMQSVFHEIPKVRASLLVFVDLNGEYANVVESKLSEALTEADFLLSDNREKANILITGNVQVEEVPLENPGWVFVRAAVSLTVTDAVTNSTVGEVSNSIRAGHLSFREAVNKSLKKISPETIKEILSYFEKKI